MSKGEDWVLHKIVWVAVESCRNDDISIVLCGQFKYSIGILGSALATIIPSDTNQASASGIRNLETMVASRNYIEGGKQYNCGWPQISTNISSQSH